MFLECGIRSRVLHLQAKEFVACSFPTKRDRQISARLSFQTSLAFSDTSSHLWHSLQTDLQTSVLAWGCVLMTFSFVDPVGHACSWRAYAVCSPYRQVTRFKGYEAKKLPVTAGPSTQKGQCLPNEVCIIYTPQSPFCHL